MKQDNEFGRFDYDKALNVLKHLLRNEIGPRILAERKKGQIKISTKKTYADIVTVADQLSERIITQHILEHYPDHAIFGEEGTKEGQVESAFEWFIDPIDGTIPYASGGENFSICVGLLEHGIPTMGIIFYPAKNKMLHAIKGRGAYLNDITIKNVKEKVDLENAVIALTAPCGPDGSSYMDIYVKPVNEHVRSLVFSGSYSADVLQFAEGALDGVVLANATAYDAVATMAIVKEAGYQVCGIGGKKIDFHKEKVPVMYSATRDLQDELMALLASKCAN